MRTCAGSHLLHRCVRLPTARVERSAHGRGNAEQACIRRTPWYCMCGVRSRRVLSSCLHACPHVPPSMLQGL